MILPSRFSLVWFVCLFAVVLTCRWKPYSLYTELTDGSRGRIGSGMEKRLAVGIQTRSKQEERKGKVAVAPGRAAGVFRRRVGSTGSTTAGRRRPEVGKWRVATEEKTGEMEVAIPSAMCGTWVGLPDVVVLRARRGQACQGVQCDLLFFFSLSSSTGGTTFMSSQAPADKITN